MSLFSELFGGGGVKSIQSGFISSTSLSTGTGEDVKHVNVTVSAVDPAKSLVLFSGGFAGAIDGAQQTSGGSSAFSATQRLTSATNLRVSVASSFPTALVGRWTILEY